MSKKTLALIAGLVLVTVILFVIALNSSKSSKQNTGNQSPAQSADVSPTVSVAHSVLNLSPNPITVAPGGAGKADVKIDTSDNNVTAVQLELSYDPKVISNVQITPGAMFQNATVLINKDNQKAGTFTYAFGKAPGQEPVIGRGVVATISFTASASTAPSTLTILPTSLVTARGIATSVLKSSSGAQIVITSGANSTAPAVKHSTPLVGR